MKAAEQISTSQITFMIILFEIGSTPLFALGGKAKQDAWLSMSFAAAIGLLLLLMYLSMQQKEPDCNFIDMLKLYFGRIAGTIAGFAYAAYFAYESMRNVRDFGEITALSLLTQTPIAVTMLIIVLVAAYAVYKGTEAVFRITQILLPVVIVSYGTLILLLFVMKAVHFERLLPVLENGPVPVIQSAWPEIISFPFGQMVIFLMFWHLRADKQQPRKAIFGAYISVSAFLIFMNALNIAVLGASIAGSSTVPFLQSVQIISIADIFERLDVFVTLLLFIGLFMKMVAFYLCAVLALSQLTAKAYQRWVLPVGAIILGASLTEPDFTYHIWFGLEISVKFFTLFQIFIPLVLWVTMLLRKKGTMQN